ncbi:MAG: DUF4468 domain-containing protein [Cytophagaceae bacterium]|nr:DUF4468 domain-containing protein [Cytophagaceae bacterium]
MRKILLSLFFVFAALIATQAQNLPVDQKTGKITYIEVVDATGMSAKDLYKTAKDWGTSKGYKIKKEDEATGEIVFEGSLPVEYTGVKGKPETGNVNFTFSVFIKEGKYRYIVTDFIHAGATPAVSGGKLESATPSCGAAGMTSATWLLIKKKTQVGMEASVADLKRVVKEVQNDPAKKSDW